MPILEVENIHSYYGNIHALKGISLTVEKGEIVTLIGANGAREVHHPAHDQRADEAKGGTCPLRWGGPGSL